MFSSAKKLKEDITLKLCGKYAPWKWFGILWRNKKIKTFKQDLVILSWGEPLKDQLIQKLWLK